METVRRTLQIVFGLVPIVAGLDKFTNILVHWDRYLAPTVAQLIPMKPSAFMDVVAAFCLARLCAVAPSRVAARDGRLRHAEAR